MPGLSNHAVAPLARAAGRRLATVRGRGLDAPFGGRNPLLAVARVAREEVRDSDDHTSSPEGEGREQFDEPPASENPPEGRAEAPGPGGEPGGGDGAPDASVEDRTDAEPAGQAASDAGGRPAPESGEHREDDTSGEPASSEGEVADGPSSTEDETAADPIPDDLPTRDDSSGRQLPASPQQEDGSGPGRETTTAIDEQKPGQGGGCDCSGASGECDCEAKGSSPHPAGAVARQPALGTLLQRLTFDDIAGAAGQAVGAVGGAVSNAAGAVGGAVMSALPSWLSDAPGEERRGSEAAEAEARATAEQGEGELAAGVEEPRTEVESEALEREAEGESQREAAQQAAEQADAGDQEVREQETSATHAVARSAPAMEQLVNPAVLAGQPEQVAQAAAELSQAGGQATGEGGAGAALGDEVAGDARASLGAAGKADWTCDEAEVLSIAGNVARNLVNRGLGVAGRVIGEDRVKRVVDTVSRIGAGVRDFVGRARQRLGKLGDSIKKRFAAVRDAVLAPARKLLDGFRTRVQGLGRSVKALAQKGRRLLGGVVKRIGDGIRARVSRTLTKAKSAVGGLVRRVNDFIAGPGKVIWDNLPMPIKAPIMAVGGAIGRAARGIRAAARGIGNLAKRARERAVSWVKARINRGLRMFAGLRKKLTAFRLRVRNLVKRGARWLRTKVSELVPEPVKRAARWAAQQVANLGKAASGVIDRASGVVCAAIDPAAEACADQHLPDIGAGGTSSIKLAATQDVTVPLHEIGVPGNLKVGQGSSVEVSRAGGAKPAKFVVKIVGDSSLALTEAKTKTDVRVGVDLPSGNKSKVDQIWKSLNAGGAGPQTPAPAPGAPQGAPGEAPAAAAGGGGGPTGSVEAGLKGKSELTYEFTAGKTNCEGVGGLVALLAAYGISGALPAPFSQMAGAATQHAFRSSLTKALFTAEAGVTGSVELSEDGLGKLQGKAGISEALTIGQERVDGQWRTVQHLTLSATLSGSAALDLGLPALSNFGGGASLGITLSMKLAYKPDLEDIVPVEVKAKGTASANVNNFDPGMFASIPGAVDAINRALGAMRGPRNAMIEGEASYTVSNLDAIIRRLSAYFHDTPAESVNVEGVIAALKAAWREVTTKFEAQVKYKQTQRAGANVRAGADLGGGAVAEAGASVSAEYSEERILFKYSSDGGVQVPQQPGQVPPQREPDVPEQPGGGGGARPRNRPPTVAEVLAMSPAEFERDEEAQRVLYQGALAFRDGMLEYGRAMIEEAGASGEAKSILKRDDFKSFVAGVLEKCKRKGYQKIGQMPDIVRGRFNLSGESDVEVVVDAMQRPSRYKVIEIVQPRREVPGVGFGYPRYHVVIRDDETTFIHEWQVGTTAVTRVFEDEGIVIPEGVHFEGHRRDIHDVQYDVFNAIIKHHPDVARKYGLAEYEREVDRLAAQAGRRGDQLLDRDKKLTGPAKEELVRLHARASEILQGIVDEHGADFINRLLKPGAGHAVDELETAGAR